MRKKEFAVTKVCLESCQHHDGVYLTDYKFLGLIQKTYWKCKSCNKEFRLDSKINGTAKS